MFQTASARALCAAIALAALGGCRTLESETDRFASREEALDKLRGYYPIIREVADDHLKVPNWIKGGKEPLIIKYEDIVSVRVVPQGKWFVLWILTGSIYGPLCHDLEVELKNGWHVPILFNCRWAWNFFPFWLYPNILIHGYGPGYALDWLRQHPKGP